MMYSIILVIRIPLNSENYSNHQSTEVSQPQPLLPFAAAKIPAVELPVAPRRNLGDMQMFNRFGQSRKKNMTQKTYVVLMVLWWLFNSYFMASLWLCDGLFHGYLMIICDHGDNTKWYESYMPWSSYMGYYGVLGGHPSYAIGIPTQIWICMRMEWWPPRPKYGYNITALLILDHMSHEIALKSR